MLEFSCGFINYRDEFYFCSRNVQAFNFQNRKEISYLNLLSSIRPVVHDSDVPASTSLNTLIQFHLILKLMLEEMMKCWERFHNCIREIEKRYWRRCNIDMMADYGWSFKLNVPDAIPNRKTRTLSFETKCRSHIKNKIK